MATLRAFVHQTECTERAEATASDQANFVSHTDTSPALYSARWCRPADYAHLIALTKVHEGSEGTGLPFLASHPERPGTSHYDIRRGVITDRLAGRLESLVFGEDRAATRSGVWNQVNTVFSAVQQDIAYPIDHQFDAIEDSLPILYSAERFACQDYLPWKGGNP